MSTLIFSVPPPQMMSPVVRRAPAPDVEIPQVPRLKHTAGTQGETLLRHHQVLQSWEGLWICFIPILFTF